MLGYFLVDSLMNSHFVKTRKLRLDFARCEEVYVQNEVNEIH